MDKAKFDFMASSQVLDVLRANPGLNLSVDDAKKAQSGGLVIAGTLLPPPTRGKLKRGCISALRYMTDGNDLVLMIVGGVTYTKNQINNLDSFRDRLQEALNFGHEISFCFYPNDRKMTMLNIYPCGCKCQCKDCKN